MAENLASSLPRLSILKTNTSSELQPFQSKLKELRTLLATLLPEDRQADVNSHLDELSDIFEGREKGKNEKEKGSDKQPEESEDLRKKKADRVILEVREGKTVQNNIRIETEPKSTKSPERKTEDKRFVKFEPKRVGNVSAQTGLAEMLKPSPHK